MQAIEEKLLWIAQFAIASDAAIEAELEFVGLASADELDQIVTDELEMSGFGFATMVAPAGERIFGMDRSLNEDVQKLLGFDLSPARDNGSTDDLISFTCTLRPTNLFGPAIFSDLVANCIIGLAFDTQADAVDEGKTTLLAHGMLRKAWVKPKGDMLDEAKLNEALDDAVLRIELLFGKCTERNNYSPFREMIAAWERG